MPRPSLPALGGRNAPALGLADDDGALVGSEEPAGYPEQCRFPGPVLPDEGVDLAGTAVDADLTKRLYRAERLRHASKREYGASMRVGTWLTLLPETARRGNLASPAGPDSTSFAFCCFQFLLRIHLLQQAQRDE